MQTVEAVPSKVKKKKGRRWKKVRKKRSRTEIEIAVPEEQKQGEPLEVEGEHHGCRGA